MCILVVFFMNTIVSALVVYLQHCTPHSTSMFKFALKIKLKH